VSELAKFRIGPWTVSPALNLLEREARSIKVEPRAMDVLVVLAQHGGAVVSVEELIASAWKGVVVGDGSVYLAIRQLRQVLDDSGDGARYIETIAKRGYRLTVPIEPVPVPAPASPAVAISVPVASAPAASASDTPAQVVTQPATGRAEKRPLLRWLIAALVGASIFAGVAFTTRDQPPRDSVKSVAVLPFENLSSDPEQAYFADGVTLEILNALSGVRDLRVTGQISSFHFKDRNQNRREAGATLGVGHLLEGSVRKAGDQVRITAQLSNASTGQQLWTETYERRLDDLFLIQDEIAKSVTNALQVKLAVGEVGREPGMTRNVAAYDAYLRGIALLDGRTESFPLAIADLQRAVALDPSFSIAWGRLSMASTNGAVVLPGRAEEWQRLSDEALEHAGALTPDAPHVLLWTGIRETRRGRWLEAASTFKRLEASYARYGMAHRAWQPRGVFLIFVGHVREALPALERARAEEPLSPDVAVYLGLAQAVKGDFTAALAEVDRGLELEGPDAPLLRAAFFIALNEHDPVEIHKRLRALIADSPPHPQHALARFVDAPAGAAAEIRRLASEASPVEKLALAFWAAYFQEPELSLQLWTQGHQSPDVLWQPLMRDVRKLPAFKDTVRELGLVDYWRTYGWSDFCRPIGDQDFTCS
jgi:TolB-like protein/DNA-binding winged helix-turn-helix (wHTH) protein